jgi:hypothetical protein
MHRDRGFACAGVIASSNRVQQSSKRLRVTQALAQFSHALSSRFVGTAYKPNDQIRFRQE